MEIISFHSNPFPPYTHTILEVNFETVYVNEKPVFFKCLFYEHECFPAGL